MGRTRTAWAVIAGLVASAAIAGPATADPSPEELQRIEEQQAGAGGTIGSFEARYVAAQTRAEQAEIDLSVAAEDYDEAVLELDRSRRAAIDARAAADRATAQVATAHRDLGRVAAQAYREGGSLSTLATFLTDRHPEQVLDRATVLAAVGGDRQRTVERLDQARTAATDLQRRAAAAVAGTGAAEQKLAAAKAAAGTRAAAARAVATQAAAERNGLLVELAAARATTVALERQRLQGLTGGPATWPAPVGDPATLGGSSTGSPAGGVAAVAWAETRIGLPYLWGGAGPNSYDCSGLVMRAWERSGVALPHSSRAQYRQALKVGYAALRPGDLLFYATDTSDPATIHHVTLYAGNNLMLEAPATGLTVRLAPVRYRGLMPYAGRP